jgi:hypothetical protein
VNASTEREVQLVKEAVDDLLLDFYLVLSGADLASVGPHVDRIRQVILQAENKEN